MLVKFSVGNFLSYNEIQSLDFVSGKLRTKKNHLYVSKDAGNVLKFISIYGANSSGKSNLFKAVNIFRDFVISGKLPNNIEDFYCKTQKENKNKPTFFEATFIINEKTYIYGMKVDFQKSLVLSEWLYQQKSEKQYFLFKKDSIERGIDFGGSFASKDLAVLGGIFQGGESPFLYNMNHNTSSFYEKNPSALILKDVFSWFSNILEVSYPDQSLNENFFVETENGLQIYSELLQKFSTGICEVIAEETNEEKVKCCFNSTERLNIELYISLMKKKFRLAEDKKKIGLVIRCRSNIFTINIEENEKIRFHVLKFVHKYANEKVLLEMGQESDGTYRLFQLLDVLVTTKEKVFFIDELSRCMHPLLTIEFMKKFFEIAENRNVQLVVTTHETRLMKHEYLRRDEIWTAQTNENGETILDNFENKKVRIDKVMEDDYMKGELGGVAKFFD